LESFILIFEKIGYKKCNGERFEFFYKKVAIYATPAFGFSHVCDQLNSGRWASKLGDLEDIEHSTLGCLEGSLTTEYGEVRQVLKKACGFCELLARSLFCVKRILGG
jgi:hypothetical protein